MGIFNFGISPLGVVLNTSALGLFSFRVFQMSRIVLPMEKAKHAAYLATLPPGTIEPMRRLIRRKGLVAAMVCTIIAAEMVWVTDEYKQRKLVEMYKKAYTEKNAVPQDVNTA